MSDLYISSRLTVPRAELVFSVSLSGGAGGQHVNKTCSRVTLRWNVLQSRALTLEEKNLLEQALRNRLTKSGELVFSSDESRSQHRNWLKVREKMALCLKKALIRPKKRKKTRPTKSSQRKRVEKKKKRGELKASRKKTQWD